MPPSSAETRPDLVGLQEVALWRSGPLQLDQVGVANATTVDQDFLQMLMNALAARGLQYVAVQAAERADVEAPSFTGTLPTIGSPRDVRLTMRDVILMRVDEGLTALASGQAEFSHNLTVVVAGRPISFDRGYNWVDVRAGARRLRFVNSHLEAFSSDPRSRTTERGRTRSLEPYREARALSRALASWTGVRDETQIVAGDRTSRVSSHWLVARPAARQGGSAQAIRRTSEHVIIGLPWSLWRSVDATSVATTRTCISGTLNRSPRAMTAAVSCGVQNAPGSIWIRATAPNRVTSTLPMP